MKKKSSRTCKANCKCNPNKDNAKFSDGLTQEQNELFLSLVDAVKLRKLKSLTNISLVTEFATVTPQKASDYIQQQIVGNVTLAQDHAQVDQTALANNVKTILKNIITAQYKYNTVTILKLLARIMVAFRDFIKPEQ